MSFEPEKFFVGLVDFFSILLPGALLAYFARAGVYYSQYGWAARPLVDAEAWLVFLVASYLLGHFVFLLGAGLDDLVYDQLRRLTKRGQINRQARGKGLCWAWLRWLVETRVLFGANADDAITRVERLKTRELGSGSGVNGFQWSKIRLSQRHAPGLAAVNRFEAHSKFFRSFVIVLLIVGGIYAARRNGMAATVAGALVLLSLWRYLEQRFKATQQAYWFVIGLDDPPPAPADARAAVVTPSPSPTNPQRAPAIPPISAPQVGAHIVTSRTHAGGVVFRRRRPRWPMRLFRHDETPIEYLVLQAKANRFEWVLPRGHIELGEDPRETAVREVLEETGVWARNVRWLQDIQLGTDATAALVRFYLMEFQRTEERDWPPEKRQHEWLPLAEARERLTFGEARLLLANADRLRRSLDAQEAKSNQEPATALTAVRIEEK